MNSQELKEVISDLGKFTDDPYGFVMYAFRWDCDELKDKKPEKWQVEQLKRIGTDLKAKRTTTSQIIQECVSSGHGIGKSAEVAWIILWALHTFEDTKIVVTANTETQLKTKTWSELAKWNRLCWFSQYFFEYTATSLYSKEPNHEKTWRADMIPWSINNTEAFAGLHNKGKRIVVIFDEASSIPDVIFDVTEGALTDSETEIIWLLFGNPTKNTGRFYECFTTFRHRWNHQRIDSRTVSLTNKEKIQEWVDDYGEDSDFVRVRVKGESPRASNSQFISSESVENSLKYECKDFNDFPKIMGVDLARFGSDQSTLLVRQGRKVFPNIRKWRKMDGMYSAGRVVEAIEQEKPDVVFIDSDGLGGAICDRIRQLVDSNLIVDVQNGVNADNYEMYFNNRTEMWGLMRDALQQGLDIPNDAELIEELKMPEYGFSSKNQIQLQKTSEMKHSPDVATALAMTYAKPFLKKPKDKLKMAGGFSFSGNSNGWMGR